MNEIISKFDFSSICRICLMKNENMNSVYLSNISKMFRICTNIKINKYDKLPQQICCNCINNMKVSYKFKRQCQKSNRILRTILQNEKFKSSATTNSIQFEPINNDPDENTIFDKKTIKTEPEVEVSPADSNELCVESPERTESRTKSWDENEYDDVTRSLEYQNDENKVDIPDWSEFNSYKCKICAKELINAYSLSRHMDTHSENRKFTHACHICKKEFSEKGNLTKHILRHKGVPKYTCDCCSKGFYELSALSVHMKQHDVTPLTCSECQKQFMLRLQLDLHFSKYHEEKKYTCETCGKKFRMKKLLKSHELSHMKRDPYPCTQCDKWFKYEASLKTHVRNAHEGPKKKDICTVCGKEVVALKYHMLMVHATERPHKCENCGMAFAVISLLNKHLKVHTGETRLYKVLCTVCGKKFQSSTGLHVHMRSHTGERPLACPMCDKTYKTMSALAVHKRSHTGERPHECLVCHKRFLTKSGVKKHSVVHTGERPYQCKICGREFGQNSTLKTHMKIH